MDELSVIGVEGGALVVASEDGTRFTVAITEALHTALRQNRPAAAAAHRVSPREIQAMIRSGMSAADVVAETGENPEYVQRFEGPVLAEREYVVTAARSVPVATAADTESGQVTQTFGSVIDERLDDVSATDVQWSSWKRDAVWTVSITFFEGEIEREAQWSFDPKKSTLAPSNHEAQSLSQQGESPASVMPRLRAVPAESEETGSRFDSGAFVLSPELGGVNRTGIRTAPPERPEVGAPMSETADLLEAPRRRRGERESAPRDDWDAAKAAHPSTGSIRIVDAPLDDALLEETAHHDEQRGTSAPSAPGFETSADTDSRSDEADPAKASARKGRAAMPSWDEIVFGARADDDPA